MSGGVSGGLVTGQERAYDQQEPLYSISPDEQVQLDTYSQFWLYACPPQNGDDIYQAQYRFLSRTSNKVATSSQGSLSKAKGLRDNTRAIFNVVPFVVQKNRELISNDAKLEGITARIHGSDDVDEGATALAREMVECCYTWSCWLGELLYGGLVTGNAFILVGPMGLEVLYPDHVFVKRNPKNFKEIICVEIKYSYSDEDGAIHTYYKRIDANEIKEQTDSEQQIITQNPLGFIPVVHIKNIPVPGKANGANCFYQYLSDIDEINEMAGDWMAAVSLYGHPHAVVENASLDGELKMDVGQVIQLPQGGKISLLEYSKLGEQWDKIVAAFTAVKGKIVEFDLQDPDAGSSSMSGYALNLKLGSLIAKVKEQQAQYEYGIAEALELGLLIATGKEYEVEVDLGPALPENIKDKTEEILALMAAGLKTKRQAMTDLGYSPEAIDAVIEEQDEALSFERELVNIEKRSVRKPPEVYQGEDGQIFTKMGSGSVGDMEAMKTALKLGEEPEVLG